MDPELAKKLKDAGFPFKSYVPVLEADINGSAVEIESFTPERFPTLEELIEACEDLVLTGSNKDGWMALDERVDANPTMYLTPTEAVARLWLALQKR